MADLDAFAALVPGDHGLVVVSTSRADGTIQSSVVNAGVMDHPVTGEPVVAFVAAGAARRQNAPPTRHSRAPLNPPAEPSGAHWAFATAGG